LFISAPFPLWGAQDLFLHDQIIAGGIRRGQELDTSKKRAIVRLQDTPYARIYGLKEDSTLVANVFHNGRFFIARIPKHGVTRTLFASEPFGGLFAHSMLHFEFAEDQTVQLIAEIPDVKAAEDRQPGKEIKPIYLRDLLLSVEVSMAKGDKDFEPVKAMAGYNGIVYRMISLTGRGTSPYLSGKKKVFETPLNLTAEESNRALEASINTSHEFAMCQMYNTVVSNCNIHVYRMLREARPLMSDEYSWSKNVAGMMLKLVDDAGIATRVWPAFGKTGLMWRGFIDFADRKPLLLNDNPRFRALAEQYECEKKLIREGQV